MIVVRICEWKIVCASVCSQGRDYWVGRRRGWARGKWKTANPPSPLFIPFTPDHHHYQPTIPSHTHRPLPTLSFISYPTLHSLLFSFIILFLLISLPHAHTHGWSFLYNPLLHVHPLLSHHLPPTPPPLVSYCLSHLTPTYTRSSIPRWVSLLTLPPTPIRFTSP